MEVGHRGVGVHGKDRSPDGPTEIWNDWEINEC